MTLDAVDNSGSAWWGRRRIRYSVALVLAGIVAFVAYAAVSAKRAPMCPEEFEITAFTILFQGTAYLLAMGVANISYNLGRWSEARFQPSNLPRYRRWTFGLGLAFSVALPFCAPLAAALARCQGIDLGFRALA